jgi:holo-[acyl-carrier protein] synthase
MKIEGGQVVAVGIDLVEIQRIRTAHQKHGHAFLEKIFTPAEQAYCLAKADPYPSLAARFAAKEALSKAFGSGIGADFLLTSLSVENNESGEPLPVLDDKAQANMKRKGASKVLLSLTHTDQLAQAIVVLVREVI